MQVQASGLDFEGIPLTVALRETPAQGGDIRVFNGDGLIYRLCGLGANCAIDFGRPSTQRLLLLRREALELALYSFRYLDVHQVVVLMPPAPKAKPSQAVFFRRGDVAPQLSRPLNASLGARTPSLRTITQAADTSLVDRLTGLFSFSLTQGNTENRGFLVLQPTADERVEHDDHDDHRDAEEEVSPAARAALDAAAERLATLDWWPRPVRMDRVRLVSAPWLFRLPWFRRFDGYTMWDLILVRMPVRDAPGDLVTHELCHVWQMQHRPAAMPLSYLRHGYARNPYELEARAARPDATPRSFEVDHSSWTVSDDLPPPPRLPAPMAHRAVDRQRPAGGRRHGHDRPHPVADRPGHRPGPPGRQGRADDARPRRARRRRRAPGADGRAAARRRARLARRRARPAAAACTRTCSPSSSGSSTASRPASSCRGRRSTCSPCASSWATG